MIQLLNIIEISLASVFLGQDFLSMDCLSSFHRHSLLVSIFIARTDDHHDVRRVATLLWKEKLQSGPKAKAMAQPFGRPFWVEHFVNFWWVNVLMFNTWLIPNDSPYIIP